MKRGGGRQGEEGKKMMKNNANARVAATGQRSLSPSPPRFWWMEAKTKGELKRCFASHYTDS